MSSLVCSRGVGGAPARGEKPVRPGRRPAAHSPPLSPAARGRTAPGRTGREAGPAGPACPSHPCPVLARRAFQGGRRSSRGSRSLPGRPAAHGGAGSNLGRNGSGAEATAPEDPFPPPPPPSSASRLNCGVRIDWECKWQLKCNLHSQQEQGGGEGAASGERDAGKGLAGPGQGEVGAEGMATHRAGRSLHPDGRHAPTCPVWSPRV